MPIGIGTPSCSFGVVRENGKCMIILGIRDQQTSDWDRDHCLGPCGALREDHCRSVCCPKAANVFGEAIAMSRRHRGDPNPSRIRIPKNSEERVFDAEFLRKSSFFVLASSWRCQSELTSPAVVFGVPGKWGKDNCFRCWNP